MQANYTFETEYKIPGTAAPDGSCSFTYQSTSRKKGEFNSPRFPSKYISGEYALSSNYSFSSSHIHRTIQPSSWLAVVHNLFIGCSSNSGNIFNSFLFSFTFLDTNCTYMFHATPNEQVTIVFDHFKVKADGANATGGAYG